MNTLGMHADSKACGTCKALVRDGKPIEHEQCAARAVLLLPPDQPMYEDLVDLTDEQRKALPARFHTPVFDGLGQPNAWLCQVCWGDGWVAQWPCGPAQEKGAMVFVSEGAAEDIATELLQSPESAAELLAYRALELGTPEGRISAKCDDSTHPVWLRDLDDMRGCPWCRVAELEAALADATEPDVDGAGRTYQEYQQPARRDLRPGAEAARRMLRDRPPAEDPHDGPLHHSYALGRDLPEVTP
ncbi:hypothetical protein [Streptomyces parvus]|uniref:hypothetical protein n=1 Tax=Streptomyces parvus TaxID=66428 RepID=UPI0033C65715